MSLKVKVDNSLMKVTDIKMEVKDSDSPKETMEFDIQQEPSDETEAIDADVLTNLQFDLLLGTSEENVETSEKEQELCHPEYHSGN